MHSARVVAATVLLVGLVQCFPWDFVVSRNKGLHFYYENGALTHTENISFVDRIASVAYDPVHYRLLFADERGLTSIIYSLDLTTGEVNNLVTTVREYYFHSVRVAYEPLTQALYWNQGYRIYTLSLNAASSNKAGGNRVLTLDHWSYDLAVDSCGGYIYWITLYEIERARLDGSEREVLIKGMVADRRSLAIDQQTQLMYWTEIRDLSNRRVTIESANFNGKNRKTLYVIINTSYATSLAISKDFFYWQNLNDEGEILQLPKNLSLTEATKLTSMHKAGCWDCHRIATKYTIQEQIQGIKSCDALQRLVPKVCWNYCVHGECRVSAEGDPTCSCKAGYSGERCEVNACLDYCLHDGVCSLDEHHQRVCQCAAGYEGERCDVTICNEYCLRGDCSIGADGRPMCSCMAGYSGERCEVSICKDYCFKGNCSVGADGQPSCSCEPGYSGERCEVNTCCHEYCLAGGFCVLNEEDMPPAYQDRAGYDGGSEEPANKDHSSEEDTASACHQFCLNDGVCSLSETGAPVCRCTTDYAGERCDVPAFLAQWVYTHVAPVTVGEVKSTSVATVVSTTELVRNERDT
ncbi:hypothetical protein PYW08_012462 [Mythimna loreyi]|uniref:Uncharacterized protein n=1 Tax=Mythimna loreyi TaxID=667449 RepID=A0ACC2Q1I8_9NEOP|nr:hypothetical protein PYW08_012462 [Mythimna loreyi]